ncbi:MAG: HYR domain-containing protein, partial [Pyrinomonadaceae bacterium]
ILVVGVADYGGGIGMARYNPNGSLDESFGIGGKVVTSFIDSNDEALDATIQSDGKIIVVGYNFVSNIDSEFLIVRYTSIGALDSTFGDGGKVVTEFFGGSTWASSVHIQTDGKLVVTGTCQNGSNTDFALARYNSNGDLDVSFGSEGKVHTDFGGQEVAFAGALQNGRIVVAGSKANPITGTAEDFALAYYDLHGVLDTSFGFEGKLTTDFFNGSDQAYAVVIQPDHKILLAGSASHNDQGDFALARYIGGSVDPTPPVLTVPSTITMTATSPAGAVVTYSVSATDNLDPNPVISCTPQSGSTFAIGATSVNCTATDASDNTAHDSFSVVVADIPPPPPPIPPAVRDKIKGIALGVIKRANVYYKDRTGYHCIDPNLPLEQCDPGLEFRELRGPQDLLGPDARFPNTTPNIQILNDSKTGWVRLWVDWPTFQPSDGDLKVMRNDPTSTTTDDFLRVMPLSNIESDPRTKPFLDNLDDQIKLARGQHLKIILTVYRFPLWLRYPACLPGCLFEERDPFLKVPDDLSNSGAWGQWISYLVERYGYSDTTKSSGRYIDFLEVCNEPNLTMWPQRVGDMTNGQIIIARRVAQMFKTAQQIVDARNTSIQGQLDAEHPTTIGLAGPATADVDDPNGAGRIKSTGYDIFARKLLDELSELRFRPKNYFAWSHHNYRDIEDDLASEFKLFPGDDVPNPDYARTNSAHWIWQLLVNGERYRNNSLYKWTGWPRANQPELLVDEGGARLYGVMKKYRICPQDIQRIKNKQASLLKKNFDRMDRNRLGQGIAMVANYLTYTDPCNDTGLFDFIGVCQSGDRPSGAPFFPVWTDRADNCQPSPQSNPDRWFNTCYPSRKAPNPLPRECTGARGGQRSAYETWKRLRSSP